MVTSGSPYGEILSPLLWKPVVDKLLKEMKGQGCKVVVYADDLRIHVQWKLSGELYTQKRPGVQSWPIDQPNKDFTGGYNQASTRLRMFLYFSDNDKNSYQRHF